MPTETVALEGDLDFATAFDAEMRLEEAIRRGDAVIVDLSRLDFIDSTGISTLLEAHRAAQRDGVRLSIVPGPAPVQKVFDVAGLLEALPFTPA